MLTYSEPPGYRRTAAIKRPKLDESTDQIEHWFSEDKGRPRKQRHTAKRIFERLRDECGFDGGYAIVKDYVRSKKRGSREMFVPLSHPLGHAQGDCSRAPPTAHTPRLSKAGTAGRRVATGPSPPCASGSKTSLARRLTIWAAPWCVPSALFELGPRSE
jgi:hypothetical protein